jgi:hypothetical protein
LLLPFSYELTILVKLITKKFEIYKKGHPERWEIAVRLKYNIAVCHRIFSIAPCFSTGFKVEQPLNTRSFTTFNRYDGFMDKGHKRPAILALEILIIPIRQTSA